MNLINKIKNSTSKIQYTFNHFISIADHGWIVKNPTVEKSFKILFESMSESHRKFIIDNGVLFIPCPKNLSLAIGEIKNQNIILIFPELITLLSSSSYLEGVSVLAHEFGHLYLGHTNKKIDSLTAQCEADHFAYQLGFGEELQNVLLQYDEGVEVRVRIAKLTSTMITDLKK